MLINILTHIKEIIAVHYLFIFADLLLLICLLYMYTKLVYVVWQCYHTLN